MKYPFLPIQQIEQAADSLLTRAFGGDLRVPVDLETVLFDVLAEEEGLAFTDQSVLGHKDGEQILGRMSPFRNQIEICASLKQPDDTGRYRGRYRFTVGHEIGHWVMHRPLHLQRKAHGSRGLFGQEGPPDHMVSLHRDVFAATDSQPPPEEVQANRFAAHLLVPTSALLREFVRRFGDPPIVTDSGRKVAVAAIELANRASPKAPTSLCDAFEVSRQAMAIALESRGYLTDQPVLL